MAPTLQELRDDAARRRQAAQQQTQPRPMPKPSPPASEAGSDFPHDYADILSQASSRRSRASNISRSSHLFEMASAKSEQFGSCTAEIPEDDEVDTKSENVDQSDKENMENVAETST